MGELKYSMEEPEKTKKGKFVSQNLAKGKTRITVFRWHYYYTISPTKRLRQ